MDSSTSFHRSPESQSADSPSPQRNQDEQQHTPVLRRSTRERIVPMKYQEYIAGKKRDSRTAMLVDSQEIPPKKLKQAIEPKNYT